MGSLFGGSCICYHDCHSRYHLRHFLFLLSRCHWQRTFCFPKLKLLKTKISLSDNAPKTIGSWVHYPKEINSLIYYQIHRLFVFVIQVPKANKILFPQFNEKKILFIFSFQKKCGQQYGIFLKCNFLSRLHFDGHE